MATRRTPPAPPPPAPPPVDGNAIEWPTEPLPEDEDQQTATDRVINLLANSDAADRSYVRVSRVVAGKLEFCAKYTVAEFEAGDLPMIREHWGSGEFHFAVYGPIPGAPNRFGLLARKTEPIAAPRAGVAPGGAVPAPSGLEAVVAQLAENQREMMRVLTERPAAPDPTASIKETLTLMTMMREAMGSGAAAPAKSSLVELAEAMRVLRDLSGEINPPASKPGPMDMLKDMLPIIQAAQQQRALAPALPGPIAAPVGGIPSTPAPVTTNPAPPAPAEGQPEVNIPELRATLATLVKMASENAPIETAAQLVYDKLPDEVIAVMEDDKWFDQFAEVAPESKPFEAWFQKVRTAALELFDDPEAP